jgi:hypothetical protein
VCRRGAERARNIAAWRGVARTRFNLGDLELIFLSKIELKCTKWVIGKL